MKKRSLSDCQHVTESFLIENMDEMIAAAREGRLLLMPKEHTQPKREDVLSSVRAYVSEIECFARRWRAYLRLPRKSVRLPRKPSDFLEIDFDFLEIDFDFLEIKVMRRIIYSHDINA